MRRLKSGLVSTVPVLAIATIRGRRMVCGRSRSLAVGCKSGTTSRKHHNWFRASAYNRYSRCTVSSHLALRWPTVLRSILRYTLVSI